MFTCITVSVVAAEDNIYYITPNDDSRGCPTNEDCHTLTEYIANNSFSHTINATFVFLEGTYELGTNVTVNEAQNMTMMVSSNMTIQCTRPVGLFFSNSTSLTISSITVSNCSYHDNMSAALTFYNVSSLSLHSIVVTDSNSRGIMVSKVENLFLHDSWFNKNVKGGIELDNVSNIMINESFFTHNMGAGEGGGLKIATSNAICPKVAVLNSNFTNNSALYGGGLLVDIQCGNISVYGCNFLYNTAQRLGGGIRVRLINGTCYPNFTFVQSTFAYNIILGENLLKSEYEPPGGGGVYAYMAQIQSTTTVNVIDCVFNGNNGSEYGGGFVINRDAHTYNNHTHMSYLVAIIITGCTFKFNLVKHYGSALSIRYISSNITISDCNLYNNSGHVNAVEDLYPYPTTIMFETVLPYNQIQCNILVDNCQFLYNYGSGIQTTSFMNNLTIINTTFQEQFGGIHVIPVDMAVFKNISILSCKPGLPAINLQCSIYTNISITDIHVVNNEGSGVLMMDCGHIYFYGNNVFANNSVSGNGGGLALFGFSSIAVTSNATLLFSNNTAGQYGGAIYDEQVKWTSSLFVYAYYCSFIPDYIEHVKFESNKAMKAGDNIYGGNYYYCTYYHNHRYHHYYPNRTNILLPTMPHHWKHPSSRSQKPFSVISSDPVAICLCNDSNVTCSSMSIFKSVYSGESFDVTIALVGIGGGVNGGSFDITTSADIELQSGASTNYISNASCHKFVYIPRLKMSFNSSLTANVTLNISNSLIPDGYFNITLTILPCPPGLVLDPEIKSCVCNDEIDLSSIKCNVSWMPHPIQHSKSIGNWIGYDDHLACIMALKECPFDYCTTLSIKFSLNESDLQCNYDRSGILCGRCKPGLSLMLGSNKCSKCSNDSLAFVIVFALCGILLVVLLIAFNLTVSVGSINGVLFYVNIVKLNEPSFFPLGGIPAISQFVAWLNLDWGINVCFYNGLDSYWKVVLQFAFPLYLWFLVTMIVVGCKYSGRLSRLCGRSAVPVLATLVLMSYTKLLRAITDALMVNTIDCGRKQWNVWNIDGNINYFQGKHIGLFVVALMFLIIGLIYTGLIFSTQWLQRYSSKCCRSRRDPVVKLKPLIDAYTGPYKDEYRFWTGLGLMVRVVLTVVFAYTSKQATSLNNCFILLTILPLVGNRVYRHNYISVIEIFSHTNLFLLALVTIALCASDADDESVSLATTVSVALEAILFLVIVIVHVIMGLKSRSPRGNQQRHVLFDYGSMISSMNWVAQRREILIYDD